MVIDITAAQAMCAIETGGVWLLASGGGKILETVPSPGEGVMQVQGFVPKNSQAGQMLESDNAEAAKAFRDIMGKLAEMEAEGFTRLNLTDLNNISLWYQDRVECQLGNTVQLDYKLQTAYGLLTEKIGLDQRGVLKLGYLPEERKSYFEAENGSAPIPEPTPTPDPAKASPSPEPEPEDEGGDTGDEEGGYEDGWSDEDWGGDENWGDEADWGDDADWDGEDWGGDEDWADPDLGTDGWEE